MKQLITLCNAVIILTLFISHAHAFEIHEAIKAKDSARAIAAIHKVKDQDQLNELLAGESPLHLAIKHDLYDVVNHLVRSKADKNILSIDQETPTLLALRLDRLEILKFLIKSNAHFENEKLYKFISNSHKQDSKQQALLPDTEFMAKIKIMLNHEGTRAVLPFMYPIFTRDEEFFNALLDIWKQNQAHNWQISQVLNGIINANFPNGLPSKEAVHHISLLLNAMRASHALRFKMWTGLKAKRDQLQKRQHRGSSNLPPNLNSYKQEWDDSDPHTIALALTDHDARLFQAISPLQLRLWLNDKNSASIVKNCVASHHKIANFFAYLIVSEADPQIRMNRLKKITRIILELENLNNFWGISHVTFGAHRTEVLRLFEAQKADTIITLIKEKSLLVAAEDQQNYDLKLAALNQNAQHIPMITHLLHALAKTYNDRQDTSDIGWFISIGKLMRDIRYHQKKSFYNIPSDKVATEIFDGAILVDDDVIAEFSNLQIPWSNSFKREKPTSPIHEWTSLDLFSYLDHSKASSMAKKLLYAGIWDGKALVNYLQYKHEPENYNGLLEQLKKEFLTNTN